MRGWWTRAIAIAAALAVLHTCANADVTCTQIPGNSGYCCDGTVAASPSQTQVFAANDTGSSQRSSMIVQNLEAKGGRDMSCDFNSAVTFGHGFWVYAGGLAFSWYAPKSVPNAAFYCSGNGGTVAIHGCDN